MKHTTNHDNKQTLKTSTPKKGYVITTETAALLDCVRANDELLNKIAKIVGTLYGTGVTDGVDILDKMIAPYLEHCTAITNMLYEEIRRRVDENLGDIANTNADCIEI